jgi:hypothetical protein
MNCTATTPAPALTADEAGVLARVFFDIGQRLPDLEAEDYFAFQFEHDPARAVLVYPVGLDETDSVEVWLDDECYAIHHGAVAGYLGGTESPLSTEGSRPPPEWRSGRS